MKLDNESSSTLGTAGFKSITLQLKAVCHHTTR